MPGRKASSFKISSPIQAKMSKSGREYFRLGVESYSSLGRVGKKEKKIACPLLDVFAWGQVSSPRLYRLITNLQPRHRLSLLGLSFYLFQVFPQLCPYWDLPEKIKIESRHLLHQEYQGKLRLFPYFGSSFFFELFLIREHWAIKLNNLIFNPWLALDNPVSDWHLDIFHNLGPLCFANVIMNIHQPFLISFFCRFLPEIFFSISKF